MLIVFFIMTMLCYLAAEGGAIFFTWLYLDAHRKKTARRLMCIDILGLGLIGLYVYSFLATIL